MKHDGNNKHHKVKPYHKDCRQYKAIELESQRRTSLVKMHGCFEMLYVLQFPESIIFQIQTLFKAGLKYRFLHHCLLCKSPNLSKAAKTQKTAFAAPWLPLSTLCMIFSIAKPWQLLRQIDWLFFLEALPAFRLWSQSQTMCFLPAVLGLHSPWQLHWKRSPYLWCIPFNSAGRNKMQPCARQAALRMSDIVSIMHSPGRYWAPFPDKGLNL